MLLAKSINKNLYHQLMIMMVQGKLSNLVKMFDQDLRRRLLIYLNSVKKISYRKLGISPSYLSKMKRGERRISDEILLKLLDNLSVKEFMSFEWLSGGRGGIRTHDLRRVRAAS